MPIAIARISPNEWSRWRDMRLNALAEAPRAFCSTLDEWRDKEEKIWRARLAEVSLNLIAELDGRDAGMVSAMAIGGEVELIAMWVAPFARGRGLGDALVDAVIQWSAAEGSSRLILRVLDGNRRAEALYLRNGFEYEQVVDSARAVERLMMFSRSGGA